MPEQGFEDYLSFIEQYQGSGPFNDGINLLTSDTEYPILSKIFKWDLKPWTLWVNRFVHRASEVRNFDVDIISNSREGDSVVLRMHYSEDGKYLAFVEREEREIFSEGQVQPPQLPEDRFVGLSFEILKFLRVKYTQPANYHSIPSSHQRF